MIHLPKSARDRLGLLKAEFDQAFASPQRADARDREGFLLVRVSGDAYAIRLNDVAALAARPRIVPVPSRCPEFLGMAGHRGSLVALFSLPRLLNYGGAESAPRWFVLLRAPGLPALAFEAYEGFAWIPTTELRAVGDAATRRYVTQAVHHANSTRLIVDVPAILGALSQETREN